jgi:peptidoglycan-N-acetylglucosamine deacetylase
MFKVSPPAFLKKIFHALVWSYPDHEREVFITFDDGPTREHTSWILGTLKAYNAKATFFLLGKNVEKHPDLYYQILKEGHAVGNHSYSHLKGLYSSTLKYISDVNKAGLLIGSSLFRPPYGKMRPSQMRSLKNRFKIIIWDVMSCDFDTSLSPEQCYENVIKNAKSGSIIVFHDSEKASKNMRAALPKVLEYFQKNNYRMLALQ